VGQPGIQNLKQAWRARAPAPHILAATHSAQKEKAIQISLNGLYFYAGDDLLSHTFACSTIGYSGKGRARVMHILLLVLLILAHGLWASTIVAWLICIVRVIRRSAVPPVFWADLIVVTLLLIPNLSGLLHPTPHPRHFLLGFALSFWLFDFLPVILALPAALLYRRLPGYLLTAGAVMQMMVVLAVMAFHRGGGIA
jgi:hypothetical protein